MTQVGLLIKLVTQAGQRDALVAHLQAAAQAIVDEPGTLLWTIHTTPTDDHTVWLYEVYADEGAQHAHETAPSYAAGMQQTQALLAAPPEVVRLTPVGGKGPTAPAAR